ncbi:MAG TPA: Hpt domain-containing protein [Bacteroidales bacterium]|nr:Hpt domain-containing protein [Bacteroidales bacterium]HPR57200.1 Hpt domain-containing protein [Bacteroidales bacterium]HRW96104.1 Hpt domain-containing protein [Bacteroidales bacterium]
MKPANERLYNLSYLKEQLGDNDEILQELIQIFLENTPADLADLNKSLENNDLEHLAAVAHKMKSSLATLKIDELKDVMVSIDKPFKTQELKKDLPGILAKINEVLAIVFEQLREDFSM